MVAAKKRIVLFLPHRADPAQGVRVSADLLPLELLQIAAFPDKEGYEVVIIDAQWTGTKIFRQNSSDTPKSRASR